MKLEFSNVNSFLGKMFLIFKNNHLVESGFGKLSTKTVNKRFSDTEIRYSNCNQYKTELEEYFSGKRKKFNFDYVLDGTLFQKRVWRVTTSIEYGNTASYQDIAKIMGNFNSARAVGNALNRNALPIVVPCHRVIRSDGSLGGFGSGNDIKKKLLNFEICYQG